MVDVNQPDMSGLEVDSLVGAKASWCKLITMFGCDGTYCVELDATLVTENLVQLRVVAPWV